MVAPVTEEDLIVSAIRPFHAVLAGSGEDGVCTAGGVDDVWPRASVDAITTCASEDVVRSSRAASEDGVVTWAAAKRISALEPPDDVVPSAPQDPIPPGRADQNVGPRSPDYPIRGSTT